MERLLNRRSEIYRINSKDKDAKLNFYNSFSKCFVNTLGNDIQNIVLLCIGTDRSTGDCLGPLVGHRLYKNKYKNIHIIGTLEHPTHAKNLEENIEYIKTEIKKPFIIALDACLGRIETIGYINLGSGPLQPGAGVNKSLPSVGDMHIKAIVNIGGFMEYTVLQSTRLSVVMNLSDIIVSGLHRHFLLISSLSSCDGFNINQLSSCKQ